MTKIINLKIILLLSTFYFLLSLSTAKAAILYLEPLSDEYHQGDTFLVEVRIDTQGEYINTIQVDLTFSSEILKVQDLSEGNSIINLWAKKPESSNSVLSFIGGIPGGYQGKDGLLVKIVFQAKEVGFAEINFLDSSKVLLNDGKGTKAELSIKKGTFDILKGEGMLRDEWQEEVSKDKISPQPFKIEINRDPLIFDGKYFITFSTTDKETGIDHYEVREGNRNWKTTDSPYLLENQKLMGTVWVRAIDKAGNYWLESLKISERADWDSVLYLGLIIFTLILILVILRILRTRNKHSLK